MKLQLCDSQNRRFLPHGKKEIWADIPLFPLYLNEEKEDNLSSYIIEKQRLSSRFTPQV